MQVRARGAGPDPRVLLGLALRNNPRRAQLLVSRVLGKHVPTDPRVVHAAGLLLGALVADALAGRPPRALPVDLLHAAVRGAPGAAGALHVEAREAIAPEAVDAVVLGFAETATALGHCVAEALGGADYLHSTRRPVAGVATAGSFVEEHSHHTGHLLLPSDPALLAGPRPLVLVDDELSTGRTAVNTITALHRAAPRAHYVLATLVDLREDALAGLPDGVRVDVVALARARLTLPPDLAERAPPCAPSWRARRPLPGRADAAASARATHPRTPCPTGWRRLLRDPRTPPTTGHLERRRSGHRLRDPRGRRRHRRTPSHGRRCCWRPRLARRTARGSAARVHRRPPPAAGRRPPRAGRRASPARPTCGRASARSCSAPRS